MRARHKAAAAAAAATLVVGVPAIGMADGDSRTDGSRGLSVVGLTQDSKLITFRADNPGRIRDVDKVTGLKGDQYLVGIDYRVQDGQLYGVGDAGGVYTIDKRGYASKVSQLTIALNGTSFGVDFNPAANRLRVVSDTGQNLRHNIDDPNGVPPAGTTANDTTLTYPATPTTPATTAVGVGAAAYTNNDLDAMTATTLFDVDSQLDQIVIQSPANAGVVQPTGKLRVDSTGQSGLDIYSRQRNSTTVDNTAVAVLQVDGKSRLYEVNLLTGTVTAVGNFGKWTVVDVAVPLKQ